MSKLLSKDQKTGIITLIILLAAIVVVVNGVSHRPQKLAMVSTVTDTIVSGNLKNAYDSTSNNDVRQVMVLHTFDPNTADSLTLLTLGFQPYQIKGMMRYRAKGGRYQQKADILKIRGISDSMYFALKPYVCIDTLRLKEERIQQWKKDSIHRDSLYLKEREVLPKDTIRYVRKLKKDTIIELNSADTTTLQLVPGIGAYRARKIVQYRQRLGGYHSVNQLRDSEMELYGQPIADSTLRCFVVEIDSVHKIAINHCSVERLNSHPYIRFNQAKAMYEWRRKKFRLLDIESLYEIKELTSEQIQRLEPYLDFEH